MQMSMKRSKSIDLTSGPILKTLAELALPIMASSFLGTAYNITDMAWIGLLGSKAVAGVGVGGMYVWLSQGLVALPRMGGQVNTAQACGRKDYKEAGFYAASALQMTILFGLLFAVASIVFLDPLIGFFNLADPDAYASARSYMLITCGLIIFSFLNLTLTGLFTAQGDSRSPLMANFLGLVGNMLLDPLLILGIGPFPRLETAGAAIATVTAQFLVFAVLVFRIFTSGLETNVLRELHLFSRFPGKFYKNIFRIGFPTAIQSMLYCMISMVLTRMVSCLRCCCHCCPACGRTDRIRFLEHRGRLCLCLKCFYRTEFRCKKIRPHPPGLPYFLWYPDNLGPYHNCSLCAAPTPDLRTVFP